MDPEVSITIDTKEDVWVMIGECMVMVMWVLKGEMFWTWVISEIEDKSGVEYSQDGKWRLTAASGEEDTKSFSILDDVDKVTKDTCMGILQIGACKLLWTGAISGILESSAVEDSKDEKWRLGAGSGEEDTKTFSVLDDVNKVTKGTCTGILKIGACKLLWTGAISWIQERSVIEDSENEKCKLRARSGEENTKTFSVPDDVGGVTDYSSRGIFKIGASEMFWTETIWMIDYESGVEDSKDGKWILTAGSGEKGTKPFHYETMLTE